MMYCGPYSDNLSTFTLLKQIAQIPQNLLLARVNDPCLFKVTMGSKGKIHTALFQAHVDDLDCIGSSDEILEHIFKLVNERWKK